MTGRYSADLTPTELEVLKLICKGLSNKEIAAVRFVSTETVKQQVRHILDKMLPVRSEGMPTRVRLANEAYRRGLVPCPCEKVET